MRIELAGIALRGYTARSTGSGGRAGLHLRRRARGGRGAEHDLEDAVDYRDVVACVREVSDGRKFHLLEALAAALVDELLA